MGPKGAECRFIYSVVGSSSAFISIIYTLVLSRSSVTPSLLFEGKKVTFSPRLAVAHLCEQYLCLL
jgi:hypothetical protein